VVDGRPAGPADRGHGQPGAAVVDVGITPDRHRTLRAWSATWPPRSPRWAGWLAPMPGGVGPMTRAMLLANVVEAAERSNP